MSGAVYAAVVAFFVAHGAQPYHAEAIARMGMAESRLTQDPPHTGLGHCMLQWVGARWLALQRFGHTVSCPPIRVQLEFAWSELASGRYECFWRARTPAEARATLRRTFGMGGRC